MAQQQKELTSIWTPANIVTCVRIVFIPIFMVVSEMAFSWGTGSEGGAAFPLSAAAFALYALLSLTDKLDGNLARSRGEITDFGKFLDPIADKLLVFSCLLILLEHAFVNVWFVFIILFREFLVSALRMVASASGEVIAADKLGKWKTATTMVSLCGYLLGYALLVAPRAWGIGMFGFWIVILAQILMIAAVILTVVSGVQYFWNARKIVFRV